jgi:hypothetical protein
MRTLPPDLLALYSSIEKIEPAAAYSSVLLLK